MKLDDLGAKETKSSFKRVKAAFMQGEVLPDYTLFAEQILMY